MDFQDLSGRREKCGFIGRPSHTSHSHFATYYKDEATPNVYEHSTANPMAWLWPFLPSPRPATRSGRTRPTTFRLIPRPTQLAVHPALLHGAQLTGPNFQYHGRCALPVGRACPRRHLPVAMQLRCDAPGHTSCTVAMRRRTPPSAPPAPRKLLRVLQNQGRLDPRADSRRHCAA